MRVLALPSGWYAGIVTTMNSPIPFLIALGLAAAPLALSAAPGDIVSAELERTMTPPAGTQFMPTL